MTGLESSYLVYQEISLDTHSYQPSSFLAAQADRAPGRTGIQPVVVMASRRLAVVPLDRRRAVGAGDAQPGQVLAASAPRQAERGGSKHRIHDAVHQDHDRLRSLHGIRRHLDEAHAPRLDGAAN